MAAPLFTQSHTGLSMTSGVSVIINAAPEIVWKVLTNAGDFPRWNSTVSGIEGEIRDGEKIRIHAPGTTRTFTPTISGFVPNRRMIWASGLPGVFRGVRTFELAPSAGGSTAFSMVERFSGVMFAMAKGSLPDFGPIFTAYAGDLRDEAERVAGAQKPASDTPAADSRKPVADPGAVPV